MIINAINFNDSTACFMSLASLKFTAKDNSNYYDGNVVNFIAETCTRDDKFLFV